MQSRSLSQPRGYLSLVTEFITELEYEQQHNFEGGNSIKNTQQENGYRLNLSDLNNSQISFDRNEETSKFGQINKSQYLPKFEEFCEKK